MIRILQRFKFTDTYYERPTQGWICGRLAEGKPCRIGPDGRGMCQANFQCSPQRQGDRWVCTNSVNAGGRCADGPLPDGTCCQPIPKCVPQRSTRQKRGRVVVWAILLVIGFLTLAATARYHDKVLSAGPLSIKHATVGDCSTCHNAAEGGVVGWIHAAFSSTSDMDDSKRCLGCHVMGDTPFNPHSLPLATLKAKQNDLVERLGPGQTPALLQASRAVFSSPMHEGEAIACANCHEEHAGIDQDLTAMSNTQCQACHSTRFSSFAEGHPAFNMYPYLRQTQIQFDHVSHVSRHFPEIKDDTVPKTCTTCHEPARDGRTMLIKGFDEACAACHLDQTTGADAVGSKGIGVLTVPGFDLEVLEERGIGIGSWPEWSEEKITPFLRVLLLQDPALATDVERLDRLDLLDLTEAGEEDLASVERVAWATKELLHDLLVDGGDHFIDGLSGGLGLDLSPALLSGLTASLPRDVVVSAQESWFPDLLNEVSLHRQGLHVPIPGEELPVDDETSEIDGETEQDALSEDDDILSEDDDILSEDDDILSEEDDILAEDDDILSEEDDILAEDDDILSEEEDILAEEDDILAEDEDLGEENEDGTSDTAPETVDVEALLASLSPEDWAGLGGWYRDEFVIFFRPTGHSDAFLQAWFDIAVKEGGSETGAAARAVVLKKLTDPATPGKCIKCHSIEQKAESDGQIVNWISSRPLPSEVKQPTRFSHTKHFPLLDDQGCFTCHQLDPLADYGSSFKNSDPHDFQSNFNTLEIEVCAECHQPQFAGDQCLLCHQYHVGEFSTLPVSTFMSEGLN